MTIQTRIPLGRWAVAVGVNPSTAWRWADSGRLNGSDAAHPLAWQDGGRWYVAPQVYAPEPATPELAPDVLTALIDQRIEQFFARAMRGA
ncbi:MAG TPA: hypothetical protein VNM48_20375 [Chloroflexota bacterium]|nr:hypothetical protein [Chloroflexota bacterium]